MRFQRHRKKDWSSIPPLRHACNTLLFFILHFLVSIPTGKDDNCLTKTMGIRLQS
jgi:hypothetical protein